METFFGIMKNEIHNGYEIEYKSFVAFVESVKEFIGIYSNERIHSKIIWIPPTKY